MVDHLLPDLQEIAYHHHIFVLMYYSPRSNCFFKSYISRRLLLYIGAQEVGFVAGWYHNCSSVT